MHMKKNQLFYLFIRIVVILLLGRETGIMAQTTISGGTSLTVLPGTTMTSGENFNIGIGATLDNQGTVMLKKNLSNSNAAANSVGPGTLQFSGAVNQAISGQNIIQNLTVNNAAGLTVSGNTKVFVVTECRNYHSGLSGGIQNCRTLSNFNWNAVDLYFYFFNHCRFNFTELVNHFFLEVVDNGGE